MKGLGELSLCVAAKRVKCLLPAVSLELATSPTNLLELHEHIMSDAKGLPAALQRKRRVVSNSSTLQGKPHGQGLPVGIESWYPSLLHSPLGMVPVKRSGS